MQLVLSALLAACAELSITAQPVQPTDRAVAVHAINTEPVPPAKVLVSDFEVLPSSVIEERESPSFAPPHRSVPARLR